MDLSVIIVNWNTGALLRRCLQAVEQSLKGIPAEIIVVDNASSDGSPAMVRRDFPGVILLVNQENLGFSKANNQAMEIGRGRYLLLLNSDAFLTAEALQTMTAVAEANPRCGIVGARLVNEDGSFQASHSRFPNLWREFLILSGLGRLVFGPRYPSSGPEIEAGPQVVDYVEGACMLVRREALLGSGGLDEGYFMYAEEVDWCYRLKQRGWSVWYQPAAEVVHLGGGSSLSRKPQREVDLYVSRVRFFRKFYGRIPAAVLRFQIYLFVCLKAPLHAALRWASGGRICRQAPSPLLLRSRFRAS